MQKPSAQLMKILGQLKAFDNTIGSILDEESQKYLDGAVEGLEFVTDDLRSAKL